MRTICALSDIHGDLVEIQPVDIVVICGDISPLSIQFKDNKMREWITSKFFEWIRQLPCNEVFMIGGNHDFYLERHSGEFRSLIKDYFLDNKLHYLHNESIVSKDGLKIYGCPYCDGPYGWAFVNKWKYEEIEDCDILITHQPPFVEMLGCSLQNDNVRDFGSENLQQAIVSHKIRYNFCGHIHTGMHGGINYPTSNVITKFYNVSIKDEGYKILYEPTYILIDETKKL